MTTRSDADEADFISDDAVEETDADLTEAESVDSSEPHPWEATANVSGKLPGITVAAEDVDFVRRVFTQVKDVDFRAPPPPPPKGLTGPDKKVSDLREKVRRLERDLARVGYVWGLKQQQINTLDEILDAKEAERSAAVTAYTQLHEKTTQATAKQKEEVAALKNLSQTLNTKRQELEETIRRENQEHTALVRDLRERLAREEQEKAALLADFRNKIEAAQSAFGQLRDQSSRTIGSLEAQVKAKDENLDTLRQEASQRDATLADRDATLTSLRAQSSATEADLNKRVAELENRVSTLGDQVVQADEKVAARDRTLASLADKLTEREKTTSQLAEEMSRARAESEQRINEMRDQVRAAEEEQARLRRQIETVQSETKQLQVEHKDLQVEHKQLQERHGKVSVDADKQASLQAEHKLLLENFEKRGAELERLKEKLAGG